MYQKSEEAVTSKVAYVADSYENWLETNKSMMMAMQMTPEIQKYCCFENRKQDEFISTRKQVFNYIVSQTNMNLNINFISVTNNKMDVYVYNGNHTLFNSGYEGAYAQCLRKSKPAKDYGTTRINFNGDFFDGSNHSITLYQPIFSVTKLNDEIGMLCLNIEDSLLASMRDSENGKMTYVADTDGNVVSSNDKGNEKTKNLKLSFKGKSSGRVYQNGNFYFFHEIGDWNYYIVSSVGISELYRSSFDVAIIMLAIMIILVVISVYIIKKIVEKSYQQVAIVVKAMDHITNEQLDYRIETKRMGADFEKLGKGFNTMMDEINDLILKVRSEQKEIDKIRLNALQSQIQPHFLYNTLECIHWQASANGDKDVSKLILALASFYRIALSKGKDVILLATELQHVKNYLIIQNQRYGDVISYDIQVDPSFMNVMIPKLTLQPLVENSIYHGIRVKEGLKGNIIITAFKEEDAVVIQVFDTGEGMHQVEIDQMNKSIANNDEGFGYGVRNVHKRIRILFGEEYGLKFMLNEKGGVSVFVRLPLTAENVEI